MIASLEKSMKATTKTTKEKRNTKKILTLLTANLTADKVKYRQLHQQRQSTIHKLQQRNAE